jgi:D-alanine-D-alanine ligase
MSKGSRVAVIMGGRSDEHEVSLNSGKKVLATLAGERPLRVVIEKDGRWVVDGVSERSAGVAIDRVKETCDVAFLALHGPFGEDGTIQGFLEVHGLAYTGSGVLASALAMDKVMSKLFYTQAGLATPDYAVLRREEPYEIDEIVATLGAKTVVKPACEGSSVGMTIVHDPKELPEAIEKAFACDRAVLIERFVSGAEVTVAVLGNEDVVALPTLEIVPEHEFYDYESKYVPGMSRHIIPAGVSEAAREECQRLAVEAHKALGCRGISRSDTIVSADGSVWLLETNTIPGMTSTSLVPDAARAAGIEFPELCAMLVEFALEPGR